MSAIKIYEQYTGEPRMFFGEGRGLQEFVNTAYPEFLKLKDNLQAQDWPHDEFTLSLDAAQLTVAHQPVKHIFTSNLQSQIFADTVQGRGPALLLPYVSDPTLEGYIIEWARSEWNHSRTYSYILSAMYPNPRIVLDLVEQKPEIFSRFSQCTQAYNTFFANPTKENLVILIGAINILEGLAFYSSFACNYGFANMGLFESVSKFLSLINRDESNHLGATIQVIKNWSKGKDGKEWKEIWHDNKHKIKEMYLDGLQEECKWSSYLFKYGTPITNLSEQSLNDYNEYMSAKRMKNIGLKLDTKVTKDPLPWIQLKYSSQMAVAAAPQETKVVAYLKNPINKLEDLSQLKTLSLR
jgi:ribonucleoside-diphosphate reductase beta chain